MRGNIADVSLVDRIERELLPCCCMTDIRAKDNEGKHIRGVFKLRNIKDDDDAWTVLPPVS